MRGRRAGLEDDIAVLARAPLFGLLDRDALRLLAFAAEARPLRAGSILFRKGDRSDGGYVVMRGRLVLDPGENGNGVPVLATPGALIGQTALFVRIERPATAVAAESSTVARVSPTLMRRVLEEFPRAAAAIHQALALDLTALSGGLERVRQRIDAIEAEKNR